MRFSVIIPIYNKIDTIKSALESVYSQTFDDFEIVLIDDGSNDGLADVLKKLQLPKMQFISQKNSGVSVARNNGIANAQGEYICFLDADDLWNYDHLETLDDLINKYPNSHTFITSHDVIMPNGEIFHSYNSLKDYNCDFETDNLLNLLNKTSYSVLHTNSMCIKKSMLAEEQIYFEPGIKIGEDTDVWYRSGLKHNVAISKKSTTIYRREYSTATKHGTHIQNWIFSLREKELLADTQISSEVKRSIICLLDRYKMAGSREYMITGNRSEARKILSQTNTKWGLRYVLTLLFTFLPYSICRCLLKSN